jgi:hypothetical protein
MQEAAKREGWIPPWIREEQQNQKKAAGKRSGSMRAARAQIRLSVVKVARARLTPEQRREPYANDSIEALCKEYRKLLAGGGGENCVSLARDGNDLCLLVPLMLAGLSKADQQMLKRAGRETLIKDLQRLRRERGVSR